MIGLHAQWRIYLVDFWWVGQSIAVDIVVDVSTLGFG